MGDSILGKSDFWSAPLKNIAQFSWEKDHLSGNIYIINRFVNSVWGGKAFPQKSPVRIALYMIATPCVTKCGKKKLIKVQGSETYKGKHWLKITYKLNTMYEGQAFEGGEEVVIWIFICSLQR